MSKRLQCSTTLSRSAVAPLSFPQISPTNSPPLSPAVKMSVTIEQHSESSFTVTFNSSDMILTAVTSSGADVEAWIDEILRIQRRRLSRLAVGFDIEWRPSYGPHQNPVAVLQLCVGRRCLVFHIIHADYVPDALSHFLSDERFTFFGVGVEEDVDKIVDEHGLSVCNAVDLRVLAADVMGRREMRQKGLAGLAMEVMGVQVHKPRRVTMSRWDNLYLTFDQIAYACVDAFLSFEIGRRLLAGEF